MTATSQWYDEFYGDGFTEDSPWYAAALQWLTSSRVNGSLLELGCGRGKLLVELARRELFKDSELYGIEQSSIAIQRASELLPNVSVGNIEHSLPFPDSKFSVIVMTEVVEHLLQPWAVLSEIRRVLRDDGKLLISFPNYLNLPWLGVRVLAELLDRPSWIVLQPVDHMFIYPIFRKKLQACGFDVDRVIGSVYFPPVLYRWEPRPITKLLNELRLGPLSLHPLLVCSPRPQ